MIELKDKFNRRHDYLRISLTDRCNLNCSYCNPRHITTFNKNELLSFEELERIINIFVKRLGVRKLRFTGGEPFARKDVLDFFSSLIPLKNKYNLILGVTTNGTLINGKIEDIKKSGIDILNISLDTLNPEKFYKITSKKIHADVISAIREAEKVKFERLKINSVIIRGTNDDEIENFIDYFKLSKVNLRFIEFMPFKNNAWGEKGYISSDEIKKIISEKYIITPEDTAGYSVSKNYQLNGFPLTLGFITPISDHFCSQCNRLRINAMGELKSCLFSSRNDNVNFKNLLSYNYSDEDICALIVNALRGKWKKHPGLQNLIRLQDNLMLNTGG